MRFVGRAQNGAVVSVRLVDGSGEHEHAVGEIAELRARPEGIVWVDIPEWTDEAEQVLTTHFYVHPLAIRDCKQRNQVPKVHVYEDHVFVVLHAPEAGEAGHVHYVELDQFVGDSFLITVHGPLNPAVRPAGRDGRGRRRCCIGSRPARLQPEGVVRDLPRAGLRARPAGCGTTLAELTQDVWRLEQRVTGGITWAIRSSSWTRCSGPGTGCSRSRPWRR